MKVFIDVVAPDGLFLDQYGFFLEGETIRYLEYFKFNRDPGEGWPDKQPKPSNYGDWLESNGLVDEDIDWEWHPHRGYYADYCRSLNPICQKTLDGRVKMGGTYSHQIEGLPICPPEVAQQAQAAFIEKLKSISIKFER